MSAQLAAILELTDQVQAAINAGDWLLAIDLDVERRNLLEQLVVAPSRSNEGAALHTALSALGQRNNHMIGEVHHHRRRVLRDASMVRTGYAAAGSYDSAALYGEE
jgi:hypothetical protein